MGRKIIDETKVGEVVGGLAGNGANWTISKLK